MELSLTRTKIPRYTVEDTKTYHVPTENFNLTLGSDGKLVIERNDDAFSTVVFNLNNDKLEELGFALLELVPYAPKGK